MQYYMLHDISERTNLSTSFRWPGEAAHRHNWVKAQAASARIQLLLTEKEPMKDTSHQSWEIQPQ